MVVSIGTLGQHSPVMIYHGSDGSDERNIANKIKTTTHTSQRVPSPEDAAAQQAVVVVFAGQGGHHVGHVDHVDHVDHPWQCFGLALLPSGLRLSFQSWTERAKDFWSSQTLLWQKGKQLCFKLLTIVVTEIE